jgi:hypothetical protein
MKTSELSCVIAGLLCVAGCASSKDSSESVVRLDIAITMGATADRITDSSPMVTFGGERLTATSSVGTDGGNRFVVLVSSALTVGMSDVTLSGPVQAGFSVPGMSGTVFYDAGTFAATAVDLSPGGEVVGTFTGLHRAADALGVAPESSAEGTIRIAVPK